MSVFDLDLRGQRRLDQDAADHPLDASDASPVASAGLGRGVGLGVMRGFARTGQFIGLAGSTVPMAIDAAFGDEEGDTTYTDLYFEGMDRYVNRAVDFWTPGPQEVGKAAQILGGLAEVIGPLMAGGGNPAATAVAVTGSQTSGTGIDLVRDGVDGHTAGAVAAVQGTAAYAGFKLPFFGRTLVSKMATGAAGNVAVNAGASAVQADILTSGGYDRQAESFNPWNVEARAIDVHSGLAFGGVAHLTGPRITPSESDAALTARNAQHFQKTTAPGVPADVAASAAHQSALEEAVEQLMRGEKVNVADVLADVRFERRQPPAGERPVVSALREAYGDTLPQAVALNTQGAPRGIRNNNPGNIERSAVRWLGEVSGADTRFATFDTPEAGIRALARNLITYQQRHGLNTVRRIIARWAPPRENATAAYEVAVARELGVDPDAPLNLRDEATLSKLSAAIIRHENGVQPYADATLAAGVRAALGARELNAHADTSLARAPRPDHGDSDARVMRALEDDPDGALAAYAQAPGAAGGRFLSERIARSVLAHEKTGSGSVANDALGASARMLVDAQFRDVLGAQEGGKVVIVTGPGAMADDAMSSSGRYADSLAVLDASRLDVDAIARKVEEAISAGKRVRVEVLDDTAAPRKPNELDSGGESLANTLRNVIGKADGVDVQHVEHASTTGKSSSDGDTPKLSEPTGPQRQDQVSESVAPGRPAQQRSRSVVARVIDRVRAAVGKPSDDGATASAEAAQPTNADLKGAAADARSPDTVPGGGPEGMEVAAAQDVAMRLPYMPVTLDDGRTVTAREAMREAADYQRQAEADSRAFAAAVTCFLGRG